MTPPKRKLIQPPTRKVIQPNKSLEPIPGLGVNVLPPHSIEAERCLLASVMLDAGVYIEVASIISPDSFFSVDHKLIYEVVSKMREASLPVDAVLVREELLRINQLDEVGGIQYLIQIYNSVPSALHGMHYARIVKEKAMLRRMIQIANDTLRRCYYQVGSSADDIIADNLDRVGKVANDSVGSAAPIHISDIVHSEYNRLSEGPKESPLMYGIKPMDDALGHPEPGEMIVIGARPSMGKSTLLRTIALSAASCGVPVGMISLEESDRKICRNFISAVGSIENHAIRRRQLSSELWSRAADSVGIIAGLPIYITNRARTIAQIRAAVSMLKAKHGVQMFIIDYLQRITGSRQKTSYDRVSEISLEVSDMAKTLEVAMLVAVQLKRLEQGKKDHIPDMDDLRDSGQIEQDADVILMLNREDYWNTKDPNYVPTKIADLHIAKCRDGQRGFPIRLHSQLQYQRFVIPEEDALI